MPSLPLWEFTWTCIYARKADLQPWTSSIIVSIVLKIHIGATCLILVISFVIYVSSNLYCSLPSYFIEIFPLVCGLTALYQIPEITSSFLNQSPNPLIHRFNTSKRNDLPQNACPLPYEPCPLPTPLPSANINNSIFRRAFLLLHY